MKNIPRHLTSNVESALKTSRVVNIVGPRQAGKTTLVKMLVPKSHYITLDDDGMRASLEQDPYGQLLLLSEVGEDSGQPIVIDEVQRLPNLTLALKRIVDENRRNGQYVLTGSSDIFTSGKAYDSLAGRVMTLTLRPLSAAEIAEAEPCRLLDVAESRSKDRATDIPKPEGYSRAKAIDLIVRGGFPEIRKIDEPERARRYLSYLDSIVERDVASIADVRKPDTLRRLIDQLGSRTGEELNMAALCNALGARKETIGDYIDILGRLQIVGRLGAWTSSNAKRDIRAPKLHFLDMGCAAAIRGEDADSFNFNGDPVALGHLLESFVFTELEKSLPFLRKTWRLYHWRYKGREVDIVAEAPGRLIALFEMKAAATVGADDFKHIDWFRAEGRGKSYKTTGFVVYLGKDILSFGDGRIAIPLSILWSYRK